jgi:hypothetical protein
MFLLFYILLLAPFISVKYIGGVMILACVYLYSNANFTMHTSRGSLAYIFEIFVLISCKFVCCHQTPKRGRLKEYFSQ